MKKQLVNRAILLSLCASLMLPVTACKKKDKPGKRREFVLEADPYFIVSEIDLPLPVDSDKEVENMFLEDCYFVGSSVVVSYDIHYKTSPEEEAEMYEKLMNGQEEEYLEWYEKYNNRGKKVFDLEGKELLDLTKYENAESRIVKILEDAQGESYAVNYQITENKSYLERIDDNGNLEKVAELPVEANDSESDAFFLENGNLLISNWNGVFVVSPEGELLCSGSNDEFLGRILIQDGKYYGVGSHFNPEDWDQNYTYVQELDTKTGEFIGEKIKCSGTSGITRGQDASYSFNANGITKIDLTDSTKNQEVFSWNDTDYNPGSVQSAYIRTDKEVYFLSSRETTESYSIDTNQVNPQLKLLHAVRAEKNPHAGKKIVRVGAFFAEDKGGSFIDNMIQYNLSENSVCRIEVTYYSLLDGNGGYSGLDMEKNLSDRVTLDMLSGSGPDILVGFSWLSRLNTDEVLVDLNPWIDAADGSGLDRNQYFDNLFRAGETGGKLYQLPITFTVSGYVANKDLMGEKESYSYQEFLDAAKALPDDVSVLPEMTYNEILASLDFIEFVDYGNKQVHFDDPAFAQLLELIKTYGSPKSHEQMAWETQQNEGYYPDSQTMFREGMVAFVNESFTNLFRFAMIRNDLGDKAVFCGAPNSQGGSMWAKYDLSMAISALSKNQAEAWDFLRFMVSEEHQLHMLEELSMPVCRAAMDRQNQSIMDANNEYIRNYILDPNNENEELPAEITKEMASELIKIVESVKIVHSSDPDVFGIIWEESLGYFENQRSVEDVSKNIQNRVETIVQER